VLGSVALQGIRLSRAALGETVFVIGLGLIGQLTVALLKAAGIRVLATDLDASKCTLAVEKMAADLARTNLSAQAISDSTRGMGADAVIITASTKAKAPMDLAAAAVRQKGRVGLVGVVGLELDRRPFYFKEAELVVSRSYGPGRYDYQYEDAGHDYPYPYVRWTERRNMEAVLELLGSGRLNLDPLISHRFPLAEALRAYELIETGREPFLGIILEYPEFTPERARPSIRLQAEAAPGKVGVGCLGAGSFARLSLLPLLSKHSALHLRVLCSAGGLSAEHSGRKLGFELVTADEDQVFSDPAVQAVFIITRHNQHASQVVKALRSGRHVFVEKPLALTLEEVAEIEACLQAAGPGPVLLMVGFNRRFSPAARRVKEFFAPVRAPLTISIRMNAGAIPEDHWVQDEAVGGGRIIGEACHAIDLATYLAGAPVRRVFAESIGGPSAPRVSDDQCFLTLRHENGSISSVAYLAGGDRAVAKERVEVLGGGRVGIIDDFRAVMLGAGGKVERVRGWRQDKGHAAEIEAFVRALLEGGPAPIPWSELRATAICSILAVTSIREGVPLDIS
jgi:predicted dehydrogenase